jgi:hypothetical protein
MRIELKVSDMMREIEIMRANKIKTNTKRV